MRRYITLTNSEIDRIISEKVHSRRDREIMRMKLIEGYTLERIAEVMEMSPRQIAAIVKKLTALCIPENCILFS